MTTRYNPGGGDPDTEISGGWHRDRSNFNNNATGRSLALKVFYYFYDVHEDGGATMLVPQTHLSDIHPRTLPDAIKDDMPGRVKAAGKAGTALIFDKRTWHARSVNASSEARRCMTLIYCNFECAPSTVLWPLCLCSITIMLISDIEQC